MSSDALPVQAAAAVPAGSLVLPHANPTDGAQSVHVDGGTVTATVDTSTLSTEATLAAAKALAHADALAQRDYIGAEVPAQSDSVDLATPAAALYVGTGGAVKYDTWNHLGATGAVRTTITLANVPDGTTITEPILRVWSTGTTASSLKVDF